MVSTSGGQARLADWKESNPILSSCHPPGSSHLPFLHLCFLSPCWPFSIFKKNKPSPFSGFSFFAAFPPCSSTATSSLPASPLFHIVLPTYTTAGCSLSCCLLDHPVVSLTATIPTILLCTHGQFCLQNDRISSICRLGRDLLPVKVEDTDFAVLMVWFSIKQLRMFMCSILPPFICWHTSIFPDRWSRFFGTERRGCPLLS